MGGSENAPAEVQGCVVNGTTCAAAWPAQLTEQTCRERKAAQSTEQNALECKKLDARGCGIDRWNPAGAESAKAGVQGCAVNGTTCESA